MSNNLSQDKKTQLKKAFDSAKSVEEKIKALKDMEMDPCFQESELGVACYIIVEKLFTQGTDFEQVLCFAKRALTIMLDNENNKNNASDASRSAANVSCFRIARVLSLLGASCFELKKYDESLSYLNRANTKLSTLGDDDDICVLHASLDIQIDLYNVKTAMGKREEVVVHSRKILELKEKFMEEDCIELGEANKDVYHAYFEDLDLNGGLPFCLKALEIFTKHLGRESVEVAQVTRHLALIYYKARDYEKALEQNQLAQSILKKVAPGSPDLLKAQADGANTLIDLGRYEEAAVILKGVVIHTDMIDETEQTKLFVTLARALCFLEKFAEAGNYIKVARRMFEEKDLDPMLVAIGFADLSVLYEKMSDLENAISMIKGVLEVTELPQKLLPEFFLRLFTLVSISDKEKEEILYMEGVFEKLKDSFGPGHCQVGYGYSSLAIAYSKLGQKELAAKYMSNAKDVLDICLGPHHMSSLTMSHVLAVYYGELGRYNQALEIEEQVIKGLKGLPPSALQFMHSVHKHLSKMKERVAESPTGASSQSNDEEDLSAKISKCDISDDGKTGD